MNHDPCTNITIACVCLWLLLLALASWFLHSSLALQSMAWQTVKQMGDQVIAWPTSDAELSVLVAFFSIASYNAFEIFASIFDIFKGRHGLYFWSMQAATWGIPIYIVFCLTSIYTLIPIIPSIIGYLIGYFLTNVSPLIVLYSRLHLVVADPRKIQWVLYTIIALSTILVVPRTVFIFGKITALPRFHEYETICSNVVMTCFCVMELSLSGIYIREAIVNFKPVLAVKGRQGRKLILHLVALYTCVIILIGIFLSLIYSHFHATAISYHAFIYSVKLKMEFGILNRLIGLVQASTDGFQTLQPWDSSHDSHTVRLDQSSSIRKQTPSPEQRGRDSFATMHDVHGTEQKRGYGEDEFGVRVPTPPRALSSDHLVMGIERV